MDIVDALYDLECANDHIAHEAAREIERLRAELQAMYEQEPVAYLSGFWRDVIDGKRDAPLGAEISFANLNWKNQIPLYSMPCASTKLQQPVVSSDWQIVPKEPTLEMVMAGEEAYDRQLDVRLVITPRHAYPSEANAELCSRVSYRAMLAAAPKM
jgi:hypothetical protein